MQKLSAGVSVLLMSATVAVAASLNSDSRRRAVLAAEEALAQAQMNNAVDTAETLLTHDYSFTLPNGEVLPKARFIADMKDWWRPTLVENTGQSVRLFGNAAIVSGEATYRWRNKSNQEEEARERYTAVYVFEEGRWLRAAAHASCLAGRCT